jgi:peptidyl-prolyl cis-trans isomerase D
MITVMRKYLKVLHIFLWLVIAAFIGSLFYIGSRDAGDAASSDSIGVVNGERIPAERFRRRYQAYVDAYSQVYHRSPTEAERDSIGQRVRDGLIQETLIVQRADREGLAVGDEELSAQIQADPSFKENGQFAIRRYQEFLRRQNRRAADFEADARRVLTRMKVENLVKSSVKVTDGEVDQAVAFRRERVRAAWALVEMAPLVAKAEVTDAELEQYLKDNQAQFRLPDRRQVAYVLLQNKSFSAAPTDAEIETYYKEHSAEFETPRRTKAAHVLIRVPDTGGSEAETKARDKAQDVIRRVKAGEDFAKLARETSEDPGTAPGGGELGWVAKGETVPQFEEVLDKLGKGGLTETPVRTPFGFHVIKVFDVQQGERKALKDVAGQIRERLSVEKAQAAAVARADEIRPALEKAPDFAAEARNLKLQPFDVTVSRTAELPGVGRDDTVQEAAFSVTVGGVSSVIKTPVGPLILKVVKHMPSAVPPLAEIKDRVADAVKARKATAAAAEKAQAVVTDARAGDFAAAVKKHGLTVIETPAFSRTQPPPDRLAGEAMIAALQTPAGGVSDPVKTLQGYYVVKTLERLAPDAVEAGKEREQIEREVLEAKRNQAWESWLNAAKTKAKIEGGALR